MRGTATGTLAMAGAEGGMDAEALIAMTLDDALVGPAVQDEMGKGMIDEGDMVRYNHHTALNLR